MPQAAAAAKKQQTDTACILLTLYDGTRQPATAPKRFLLRVRDGNQKVIFQDYVSGPRVTIKVPFHDNLWDNYTVLVTAGGFRDAGFFPVRVSPALDVSLDLMLVAKNAKFSFVPWEGLKSRYPRFAKFFCCEGNARPAQQHYESLVDTRPQALASLLNLTAAMSAINLPTGTPLDYFKRIEWGESLAQDRFFGFADEAIVQQVRTAAAQGFFVPEPSPGLFHGDATSSYKQVQFGEANVQLTFHENTVETIAGMRCIRVEPDIDYFTDLGAHALLEVVPNSLSHGLTDPQVVYVLRWIAGRRAGVPEFDPSYTLAP